jgi:hypothetical protein
MSAWLERQQARTIRPAADGPVEDITHQRISLYKEPPSGEVCIEEFERFAIDRLRGNCILELPNAILPLVICAPV